MLGRIAYGINELNMRVWFKKGLTQHPHPPHVGQRQTRMIDWFAAILVN